MLLVSSKSFLSRRAFATKQTLRSISIGGQTKYTRLYTMTSTSSAPQNSICVAVVGVGLVGSEFINQLLSFPKPSPFRIVSLSSSKINFFHPDGLSITTTGWKSDLAAAGALNKLNFQGLIRELAGLVTPSQKVVLVDNTSSE